MVISARECTVAKVTPAEPVVAASLAQAFTQVVASCRADLVDNLECTSVTRPAASSFAKATNLVGRHILVSILLVPRPQIRQSERWNCLHLASMAQFRLHWTGVLVKAPSQNVRLRPLKPMCPCSLKLFLHGCS